jgi:hypothetical protein
MCFYILSTLMSLFTFFYYTSMMGLYSKSVIFSNKDKLIFIICFIIIFIPYINFVIYGSLFILLLVVALLYFHSALNWKNN